MTDNGLKSYIKSYYEDRKITYTKLDKHDRAIGVLINENEKLNNRINKAIEYIKENKDGTDCCGEIYTNLGEIEIEELLKILKGENNE